MREIVPADISSVQRNTLRELRTWKKFHFGPRAEPLGLLRELVRYSDSVLVAGCQRSGTTMLTRLIAGAKGFTRLALTSDDELDAALALSGKIDLPKEHRYCFQTTYLNERYIEYRTLGPSTKLIWVVRNPASVVYSMIYNWKMFALNELYASCGIRLTEEPRLQRHGLLWPLGPSKLEKACYSYAAKSQQLREISEWLPASNLFVVDYDSLVLTPENWLPAIFNFIEEPYESSYPASLSKGSLDKRTLLNQHQKQLVKDIDFQIYQECLEHVSDPRDYL